MCCCVCGGVGDGALGRIHRTGHRLCPA
jgi:hypothetical protein